MKTPAQPESEAAVEAMAKGIGVGCEEITSGSWVLKQVDKIVNDIIWFLNVLKYCLMITLNDDG